MSNYQGGIYRCGCSIVSSFSRFEGLFPATIQQCPEHNEPIFWWGEAWDAEASTKEISRLMCDVVTSEVPLMKYLKFIEKPVHERIKIRAGELIKRLEQL